MNVGIIGSGIISGKHVAAFESIAEIGLISIADISEKALARTKEQFPSVNTTTDYHTILEDPTVKIVDICLPHFLHRKVVFEALDAGKHVFCEKPISITLEDALAMKQKAKEKNLKLCILLNHMFTPAHRKTKEMIEKGELGRVFLGVWNMIGDELARMQIKDNWKCDIEKSGGGALLDTGMHAAYVLLDLFGKAKRVNTISRRMIVEHDNKGEDNGLVSIEFESGALVSYTQSYTVTTEEWNERKYVYGTKGSLHIDDTSIDAPLTCYTEEDKNPRTIEVDTAVSMIDETIDRCLKHHVSHLLNGTPLLYTTDLAIDALRLIHACYRANDLNQTVEVDEIE